MNRVVSITAECEAVSNSLRLPACSLLCWLTASCAIVVVLLRWGKKAKCVESVCVKAETKTCDVQHLAVSFSCVSGLQGAQKLWILSSISVLFIAISTQVSRWLTAARGRFSRSVSPRVISHFLLIRRPFFRSHLPQCLHPCRAACQTNPAVWWVHLTAPLQNKSHPPTGSWMAKMMIMRVL